MGFYFVTTGWIFEIGLCVNSINQINKKCSYFKSFSGFSEHSTSSTNANLMKDNIQRRSPHPRRHRSRDENERIAIAAFVLVVVTSVAVARSRQTQTKFRVSAIPRPRLDWGSHVQRSLREGTFRRKYCMYFPTPSKLVNLLGTTLEWQEHFASELRLWSALFPNLEPKCREYYVQTLLLKKGTYLLRISFRLYDMFVVQRSFSSQGIEPCWRIVNCP